VGLDLLLRRAPLVVLAVATIAVADLGAVDATRSGLHLLDPTRRTVEDPTLTQLSSLRQQFATQVPAGSRTLVETSTETLWGQRLVEIAVMQGVPVVPSAADADVAVSVAPAPGGLRLVVRRVPRDVR
jgi:hypothetical protein